MLIAKGKANMLMRTVQSNETKKVIALAKTLHWGLRVVGTEPMISSPEYRNGWWFVPVSEDKTIIPKKAWERVATMQLLDFKIQGMIVAHEAPKLLTAPKIAEFPPKPVEIDWIGFGKVLKRGLVILGQMMFVLFCFTGMGLVMMVDPALIVVLDDGKWVEVYRWQE